MIWLLAALLFSLFLLGGWLLMKSVCGRCPLPASTDPQRHPSPAAAEEFLNGRPVKFLHVESYDRKLLCGRFVPCDNARGTLLLFHGYHANAMLDYAPTMEYYHNLGFHLLLVDQRAHGKSQGRFLTFGLKERMDVLSWVTYLSLMLGETHPIFLMGMSLGAATVTMASALDFPGNVRGIISDCGYSSVRDIIHSVVARDHPHLAGFLTGLFGIFSLLYGGFGLRDWTSAEALAETSLPVLFIHGLVDHCVPCSMTRVSYDACRSDKTLLEVPGADHCRSFQVDPAACKQAVDAFFDKNLKEREPQ